MKRNEINHLLNKIEKTYPNAGNMKSQILADNKQQSGIFMWTNLVTLEIYIGSSINLYRRFVSYFSLAHISNPVRSNSIIHKALIKYGYFNFQLEIIEYCDPSACITLEQHYINLLNPQYNVLKTAGSSTGYKHSNETLEKMRKHLKVHNAKKSIPVEITDSITNEKTNYDSITAAAKALNTNEKNVRYAAKFNKLLLKKYIVTIIRDRES